MLCDVSEPVFFSTPVIKANILVCFEQQKIRSVGFVSFFSLYLVKHFIFINMWLIEVSHPSPPESCYPPKVVCFTVFFGEPERPFDKEGGGG